MSPSEPYLHYSRNKNDETNQKPTETYRCRWLSLPGIRAVDLLRQASLDVAQLEPVDILRSRGCGGADFNLANDKVANGSSEVKLGRDTIPSDWVMDEVVVSQEGQGFRLVICTTREGSFVDGCDQEILDFREGIGEHDARDVKELSNRAGAPVWI